MTTIPQLLPKGRHAGTAVKYSGIAAEYSGTQPAATTSASPPKQEPEPTDSLSGEETIPDDVWL